MFRKQTDLTAVAVIDAIRLIDAIQLIVFLHSRLCELSHL